MTCVIGYVGEDADYIAADSAGVGGYYAIRTRKDPKVFKRDDLLIGYTTSFRLGQLLRYVTVPGINVGLDRFDWMVRDFIPKVREKLKSGGFAKVKEEREEGGTFIVVVDGRLFEVHSDFQVAEHLESYTAVGCGQEFALGALAALDGPMGDDGFPEETQIRHALEIAEQFSAGVRGPFIVIKNKRSKST